MNEAPLRARDGDDGERLRRPRQHRSRRSLDRMLNAVESLVSVKGVEALTLAELLRNSGVSNGTFYARFSSKDALVHELQNRVLSRLEARIERECAALQDLSIPLQAAVSRLTNELAGQFRDNAGLLASLMHQGARDAVMQRRATQTHAVMERLFIQALAPRLRSAGQPECDRLSTMAHTVLSAVLIERISGGPKLAGGWEILIQEMIRLLLGYLGAPVDFALESTVSTPGSPPSDADSQVQGGSADRPPSPFSQRKIDQILSAASALFTGLGFGATTMSRVAADAGVGKATVYAHFKSKAELFAAVIEKAGEAHVGPMQLAPELDIETVLEKFGRAAFELLLRPSTTAFFRIIAAEATRFPELGRIFYDTGPARLQASLAAMLAAAMERGDLRRHPPHLAACQYLGLICGDLQLQAIIGAGRAITRQQRDAVLQSGLKAFLLAYRPSG